MAVAQAPMHAHVNQALYLHEEMPKAWGRWTLGARSEQVRVGCLTGNALCANPVQKSFTPLSAAVGLQYNLAPGWQWSTHVARTGDIALSEPGWADRLLDALASPGLAWLLLLIGGVGLYIELHTPGFGLGGFVSMVIDGVSVPATLPFPPVSLNRPAFTVTVPLPVAFAVGMNRAVILVHNHPSGVPHGRGDEPHGDASGAASYLRSPRAWG